MESQIEMYCGQRVVFAKKDDFLLKLDRFKSRGPSKLRIVSDFDFTISKFHMNGKRGASCHKVIEDCGLLTQDYHTNAQALQLKYYPLEVDPTLNMEEKTTFMIEWVAKAHKLLAQSGLTKETIAKAVAEAIKNRRVGIRERVGEFFALLAQSNVPTLVFSAGIADVLEEILRVEFKIDWSLVHIISNRCIFNGANGEVDSFVEPLLHVFNKKSSPYLHTDFFKIPGIEERTNLLLMGDSLGDVSMSEGMEIDADSIIKIGFLSDREERLPEYLECFDVVILDDPGFDVPLGIVEAICNGQEL